MTIYLNSLKKKKKKEALLLYFYPSFELQQLIHSADQLL